MSALQSLIDTSINFDFLFLFLLSRKGNKNFKLANHMFTYKLIPYILYSEDLSPKKSVSQYLNLL